MEEEGAFPRGGASSITPLKRRQIRQEAHAEAEKDFFADAEASTDGNRKRQKKSKLSTSTQALESQFVRKFAQEKLPAFVELLKFKTCTVGAKVWGAISDVLPQGLVISLPDGLKGHVSAQEASDVLAKLHSQSQPLPKLTDLFSTGQLARCTILSLEQQQGKASSLASKGTKSSKKAVHLSLQTSKVNAGLTADALQDGFALSACVTSIEDHGYGLSFGVKGVNGFLPKKTHAKAYGSASVLKPGMLVECVVTSAAKRLVKVTTDPEALNGAVLRDWEGMHIGSLMPGSLVSAKVEKVLSDGLTLSFLTFFSGTVDQFHLAQACPRGDWRKQYSEQQKVQARVLYVDATSKKIMLSLQPDLTNLTLRSLPAIGEVFEGSIVTRIDEGLGLVLELPTEPAVAPGFVHISNAGDNKIDKLQQAYKVGQKVKGRVIGARQLDGLSVLSLKPAVVEQQVASIAAVKPGSLMTGTIHSIADYGMLVSLAPGIRALVPAMHMASISSKKGPSKYKDGQQVTGRILEVDAAKKRVSMSLKKLLCSDKLPTITCFQDAEPGVRSHGYITGVKPYGVFISFCGGMKGLAHTAELPLGPDQKPSDAYTIGQVVKCRVLSSDISHQRLKLSLTGKKSSAEGEDAPEGDALGGLQPGDVVQGTVTEIETAQEGGEAAAVSYTVELEGGAHGQLDARHLADHPTAVAALQAVVKLGSPLGSLLVLERAEAAGVVKLTRKASLIAAASTLPKNVADIKETLLVPGYIASVTNDACYVRFLNQLTGRAGLAQLADLFVSDPGRHYHVGQSVKAQVVQVDADKERFSVTLKHSLVGSSDAAYLQSLFKDLELAEKLKALTEADEGPPVGWEQDFAIGALAEASVHEQKDYGVVFDFAAHPDVLGLAAMHQVEGPELSPGTATKARILDVSKDVGIVDVSLKPALVEAAAAAAAGAGRTGEGRADEVTKKGSKKRKAAEALDAAHATDSQLKVGKEPMTATVELVKDDYVVLSLPKHRHTLGFAAVKDFNLQSQEGRTPLKQGQIVQAQVAALPSPATGGRLVMHIPLLTDAQAAKKGTSKGFALTVGQLVQARVTAVCPAWLDVSVQAGSKGRISITEVQDAEQALANNSNPLQPYSIGQNLEAVHLGYVEGFQGRKLGMLDLSLRTAVLAAARKDGNIGPLKKRANKFKPGHTVYGYVQEVADDHVLVQLASTIRGRLSIFDSAEEPQQLSQFPHGFKEGQPIKCRISQVDKNHGHADISLRDLSSNSKASSATAASAPPGTLLLGKVVSLSGGSVHVHVGRRAYGRVALSDVHDGWVRNALEGIQEGLFVQCCVLGSAPAQGKTKTGKKGSGKRQGQEQGPELQLSLQPSKGGKWAGQGGAQKQAKTEKVAAVTTLEKLKEGDKVGGYVKGVSAVGMFVSLSSSVEARVKLGQLSDTFVEDPQATFPVGQFVTGRILSIQGDRVEMTLKESQGSGWADLGQLKKGETVRGKIKRLEGFGAFVQLDNSNLTGLAHISEISDDYVRDLHTILQVGQGVRAKVLDVDSAHRRLSLGLKQSYFTSDEDMAATGAEAGSDIEEEMAELASDSDEDAGEADEELEETDKIIADALKASGAHSDDEDKEEDGEEEDAEHDEESDEESDEEVDVDNFSEDSEASSAASDEEEEEEEDEETQPAGAQQAKRQKLNTGLLQGLGSVGWDASDDEEDQQIAAPADTEPQTNGAKKLTRAQKRREKDEHEEQVRQRELARVSDSASQPESAEDFERLVMGEPDNSLVWIQFMALLVALGEVDRARGIAKRALATINFREEKEKFNIWQAWLNLENMYGSPTPDEAVTRLFQKALPYCNAKRLYLALLDILERTDKDELAEQTLKAMCRKFSSSAKIWMRQIAWLIAKDQPDAVKRTLDKAFKALPQRKHIKVISQTAIQEFKQEKGSAERGRSMFESCLRNYPSRLDVWSQYLDQEIRLGEKQRIEALFERATHLQLPPKKMKFLFKRYLQYEQDHGDAAAVAHVKKQALAFVQQHA